MITLHVSAEVSADRRVVLTLPESVRPGRVELTVNVAQPDDPQDEPITVDLGSLAYLLPNRRVTPGLKPEYDAFWRLLPELLVTHPGQYVAVRNEQVEDADPDGRRLADRVYAKYGLADVWIDRVTATPAMPFRRYYREIERVGP